MRRSLDAISVLSTDDLADYDVISDGPRSIESSIADLGHVDRPSLLEPPPLPSAQERFATAALSAEDIQAYVQRAVGHAEPRSTWRVYVDGVFGPLTPRELLQLRQAKLAFPSVHLVVGVFSDDICEAHDVPVPAALPHQDRCEVVRHCRWVDEVAPDAPWTLNEKFLRAKHVDYVAIDEGVSVDPDCDRERLKGYDLVKSLRKAIPTRRTQPATPAPKSLDASKESKKGTVKSIPMSLQEELRETLADQDPAFDTPFVAPVEPRVEQEPEEDDGDVPEPRVDEFGGSVL